MDNICVLLILFLIVPTIEAKCSYENGVNRFGDNCGFMCHCEGNRECDVVTGECSSGCARGWYGPGCQYRDILRNKYSKFSDTSRILFVTDGDPNTCFQQVKSSRTKNLSWKVRLDSNETINEIQIATTAKSLGHGQKNLPYVVDITADTNEASTFSTNELSNDTQIVALNLIGRFVTISINGESKLAVCEISVFGGCDNGYYGQNCSKTCSNHCRHGNTYCNAVNGTCIHGCRRGWKEPLCETCNAGYYGRDCKKTCSVNCEGGNTNCDPTTGHCKKGCKPGWIEPQCTRACSSGMYGQRCAYSCSQRCDKKECNNNDGRCTSGCIPGWTGETCAKHCDEGYHGENCSKKCSGHCKNGYCNNVNGHCTYGCMDGWKTPLCDQACSSGRYGPRCAYPCSQRCDKQECINTDGRCTHGCIPGWTGETCAKRCSPGKFGIGCKESCPSNCKHDVCGYVNGDCDEGCKLGFQGKKCKENCTSGTYGDNCGTKCSDYCEGGDKMCRPTDGHCLNGCLAGWNGTNCFSVCVIGFYGKNCALVCGNCQLGNGCHHITGTCHGGCKTGYSGATCLQVSDKIVSDTNPCIGCHETPKPNILLICVGILCVILVVYATVITILFKRKTKHNEEDGNDRSCCGWSYANKTNKKETVTAETAPEAAIELARVNINAIDDESHQYTDLTPDTGDVEAAYETIQLE